MEQSVQTNKLKEGATKIWIDRINAYIDKNPKSKTLKKIHKYTLEIRQSKDEKRILKLGSKVAYFLRVIVEKTGYVKDEKEREHWLKVSEEMFKISREEIPTA